MAVDKIPITPLGAENLKQELVRLREQRPHISKEIGVARELGDLSENAEYHAAKEKQGLVEAKIKDLEDKIARLEVIDPKSLSGDRIRFGATVTLTNIDTDETVTYQIVGADESNIDAGTISISAPLARALIGKEVGEEVTVRLPGGTRTFEIDRVEYR